MNIEFKCQVKKHPCDIILVFKQRFYNDERYVMIKNLTNLKWMRLFSNQFYLKSLVNHYSLYFLLKLLKLKAKSYKLKSRKAEKLKR